MGSILTKTLDPPVSVNEWDSLKQEALQLRMSLITLIQDIEKWPIFYNDYEKRYNTIRKQWQIVYSMLLQMIKSNRVYNINDSLEWCKQIRQDSDRLAERYLMLRKSKLSTIDEKEEPLL